MKLIKILTLASLFAFVSAFAGCGKKDEKKDKANTAAKAGEKKAGDTTPTPPPVKPDVKPPEPPAAGAGGEMDFEKAVQFTEKMGEIVEASKDDCAKMAAGISKLVDDNEEMVEMGKALQADPAKAQKVMEKYKDRMTAATMKMAAMGECATDPAMAEAMKKLQ